MYFDDCERRSLPEQWEVWIPDSKQTIPCERTDGTWQTTQAEAKMDAMDRLLGYNMDSTAILSEEQIEDETLYWALDCNIIWAGDDDDDEILGINSKRQCSTPEKAMTSKYHSISDLVIARDCTTTIDALAFLWNLMAKLLDSEQINSLHMVVFPSVSAMWQYDVMVTVLQALMISKPLLPPHMQHVQLDLFHPHYKNSPRMWSPEMHSPFPTLGLSIQGQPATMSTTSNKSTPYNAVIGTSLDDDLDATRSRLEALFESIDADDRVTTRLFEDNVDTKEIMADCYRWAESFTLRHDSLNIQWVVDTHSEPFHLYSRLWSVIKGLQARSHDKDAKRTTSTMLVAPNIDSYTTKRLAITVNAALRKLHSPIRVLNVFHPSSSTSRQAPYAMILLGDQLINDASSN